MINLLHFESNRYKFFIFDWLWKLLRTSVERRLLSLTNYSLSWFPGSDKVREAEASSWRTTERLWLHLRYCGAPQTKLGTKSCLCTLLFTSEKHVYNRLKSAGCVWQGRKWMNEKETLEHLSPKLVLLFLHFITTLQWTPPSPPRSYCLSL